MDSGIGPVKELLLIPLYNFHKIETNKIKNKKY